MNSVDFLPNDYRRRAANRRSHVWLFIALMIYGGTIRAGRGSEGEKLDIVSAFQSYGELLAHSIDERKRLDIVEHACPGLVDAIEGGDEAAAERIVKTTGIKRGYCLVLGCGTGQLAVEYVYNSPNTNFRATASRACSP